MEALLALPVLPFWVLIHLPWTISYTWPWVVGACALLPLTREWPWHVRIPSRCLPIAIASAPNVAQCSCSGTIIPAWLITSPADVPPEARSEAAAMIFIVWLLLSLLASLWSANRQVQASRA
jgi:hypothetical protein